MVRRRDVPRRTVLCLGLDPFLLRLVRTAHPEAIVRLARDADELLQELCREPDAIVQLPVPGLHLEVGSDFEDRVVAVVDRRPGAEPVAPPAGAGAVLVRPVDVRQLRLAVDRAFGQRGRLSDRLRDRARHRDLSWSPPSLFSALRLALSLVVLLQVVAIVAIDGRGTLPIAVALAALVGHAVWRIRHDWLQPLFLLVDALLAAGVGFIVGEHPSPVILLLVLVAAQLGVVGTLAALTVISVVVALVAALGVLGGLPSLITIATIALVLVAAQLGTALATVTVDRRRRHRRALTDVHAALRDLHEHARANPARLHASTLRAGILESTADWLDGDRIALLCGPPDDWRRPLVRGLPATAIDVQGDVAEELVGLDSPAASDSPILASLVGGATTVLVAPLRFDGLLLGGLVVGWDRHLSRAEQRDRLDALRGVAQDAAVALDSAELFAALDDLSVSGERQRIARDLHDGIVQSFVHVGLELDRLADGLADVDLSSALQVLRLRNVVQGTVMDARAVIGRLRLQNLDRGLRSAIASHLQEVRGVEGPTLRLDWPAEAGDVAAEVATDLFRFVQEGVANARQHARAQEIVVRVDHRDGYVEVAVSDDGTGLSGATQAPLRGRGLPAMRERMELLGGRLEVRSRPGEGTTVVAAVPEAWVVPTAPPVPQESLR